MNQSISIQSGLTWSWCIATYKRHDVLCQAAEHVLRQSYPPSELVITDASPDWRVGKEQLETTVARLTGPASPRVHYQPATVPSSAAQRNQSIESSTADIVFLLDDDTFLYPDCAAKLLEVYDKDTRGTVPSVVAVNAARMPPSHSDRNVTGPMPAPLEHKTNVFATFARRMLRADDIFVPYDISYPDHPIPEYLSSLPLATRRSVAGYCLTCRREVALREPFNGRLRRYCPGEDSDMTYRLSRHGPILARTDALLYHAEAPGERLELFERTALGAVNPLLLHRLHSADLSYSAKRNAALLRRRLVIELAKDISSRSLTLPRARGILFALRQLDPIFRSDDETFDTLFEDLQQRLAG